MSNKNQIYAKELRKNMTEAEKILWNILRAKRFHNLKFKRQVLIGNYIVDFICFEKSLIIELDGGQHNEDDTRKYDDKRTQYLIDKGFKAIRFWNNDVMKNVDGVCEAILRAVNL